MGRQGGQERGQGEGRQEPCLQQQVGRAGLEPLPHLPQGGLLGSGCPAGHQGGSPVLQGLLVEQEARQRPQAAQCGGLVGEPARQRGHAHPPLPCQPPPHGRLALLGQEAQVRGTLLRPRPGWGWPLQALMPRGCPSWAEATWQRQLAGPTRLGLRVVGQGLGRGQRPGHRCLPSHLGFSGAGRSPRAVGHVTVPLCRALGRGGCLGRGIGPHTHVGWGLLGAPARPRLRQGRRRRARQPLGVRRPCWPGKAHHSWHREQPLGCEHPGNGQRGAGHHVGCARVCSQSRR